MAAIASIRPLGRARVAPGQESRGSGAMRLIVLEDGRRLRVDAEQIARHGLAPGEMIEDDLVTRLEARDRYLTVREAAVRLLAVRPRSIAELRTRLRQKRLPEPQVRDVLRDLIAAGYLDDLAFARALVAGRLSARRYGIRRIRSELRQKGVPAPLVDQALQEACREEGMAAVEERSARALIERRLRSSAGRPPAGLARLSPAGLAGLSPAGLAGLSPAGLAGLTPARLARLTPERRARRIAGLLERRGFSPETIARVLRTLRRPDLAEVLDG